MLLMIDNYDSFTYNLVQYFGELGEDVAVFRNDEITPDEIIKLEPSFIVISPGPCTPNPFTATRYHSLAIEEKSLPDCLEITARAEDGEIMGVRHKDLAIQGVQFHPESFLTEHGHKLLKNFLTQ